jgi:hypothetical protein
MLYDGYFRLLMSFENGRFQLLTTMPIWNQRRRVESIHGGCVLHVTSILSSHSPSFLEAGNLKIVISPANIMSCWARQKKTTRILIIVSIVGFLLW